ncbi:MULTISPECIES: BON domain-containing protein [unclassified Pseudonocardia]|jgi:osmotically-inducible protein OsmY|uniref:BON domain-containing protein n=1 Tax=unclassified Pseudonocardia TaxID=2619320 RepID=UPI000961BF72|nr:MULTISPECIES: BON domain-containing protein [unclassified Pseudonocardia]MBN9101003.1 BON domain-containing protein [Pseudonocardia sp.]OJY39350.1 MAG: hypothetical protein BGP03_05980 [Pseudonocardia sp. 73-21]
MTRRAARPDDELRAAVADAIGDTVGVHPAHLGVSATDGTVTLSGEVATHPERMLAERTALHTPGVEAVANEVTVRSRGATPSTTRIAREVAAALRDVDGVPPGAVAVAVHHRSVILTGTLAEQPLRAAVEYAVRRVPGVVGIQNLIRTRR